MPYFSRRPAARVPHDEPGFGQADFVAEYGAQTAKFPAEFQPVLDYLTGQLGPTRPAHILEIGPGPGWMAIRLAQAHPAVRVTGLDVSEEFVALANENSRREGVADRATFLVGDATTMNGFADRSFDVVMSNQSFHYWDPLEGVLDQIARVLTPSGVFCIGDDRRDMQWRGKLQVFLGRCFLSRRIGASWARSLMGSLTLAEAADALEHSQLRDRWQIAIRPRSMLITSKPVV
ncbi:MAG TPA: class I SAM-dependent methyltransferase [Pirellulales bacterium]|jgi:SAM-dependent methyltransferase